MADFQLTSLTSIAPLIGKISNIQWNGDNWPIKVIGSSKDSGWTLCGLYDVAPRPHYLFNVRLEYLPSYPGILYFRDLHRSETRSGSNIISFARTFAQQLGFRELLLTDGAVIELEGPKKPARYSLSLALILAGGTTFYEKYGFVPILEPSNILWRIFMNCSDITDGTEAILDERRSLVATIGGLSLRNICLDIQQIIGASVLAELIVILPGANVPSDTEDIKKSNYLYFANECRTAPFLAGHTQFINYCKQYPRATPLTLLNELRQDNPRAYAFLETTLFGEYASPLSLPCAIHFNRFIVALKKLRALITNVKYRLLLDQ